MDREGTGLRLKILNEIFSGVLPEKAGISAAAWNNYEAGLRFPSIEDGLKISEATGATLDFIYKGDASAVRNDLFQKLKNHRWPD